MSAQSLRAVGPTDRERAGLWDDSAFRILTITNSSIVLISAVVGLMHAWLPDSQVIRTLLVTLPVVPATVIAPAVSLVIVFVAAALSTLNMIGSPQKGVRFLRAFTVWGTLVLAVPVLLTVIAGGFSLLAAVLDALR